MIHKIQYLWRLVSGTDAKTHAFSALARHWSNAELELLSPHVTGDVVNVSAWLDEDKQGRHYRDYFPHANRYAITNMDGDRGLGDRQAQSDSDQYRLDLTEPLPNELEQAFDVVFNHTTLEHVFDTQTAFHNLCAMSRDLVVLVVPYLQPNHGTEGIPDYWRFTPYALRHMFAKHGFDVVYESATPHSFSSIYLFCVGSKYPDRWRPLLPQTRLPDYGLGLSVFLSGHWQRVKHLIGRSFKSGNHKHT